MARGGITSPGERKSLRSKIGAIFGKLGQADPDVPQGIEGMKWDDLRAIFDAIRQEIKREDDLINQRNTWCILLTTAIVAGVVTFGVRVELKDPAPIYWVSSIACAIGMTISYKCMGAVLAARNQIEYLFGTYTKYRYVFCPRAFSGRSENRRPMLWA